VTFAQRLRRIPLLVWIVAPVALAALVAWPLGGWDTVTLVSRTLPQYDSNETLHGHRFDIRVDDAWLTDVHPVWGPKDGEQYLVVVAEITNTTRDAAGASDLRGYLQPQIEGFDADAFGVLDYALAVDRTSLPELNPGLTRDLELIYTIPPGSVHEGQDLRIDLYDAIPRKAFLYRGLAWDQFLAAYAVRNVGTR
jgi:hypothetical protein